VSGSGKHFVIVVDQAHCILDFRPEFQTLLKNNTLLGGADHCTVLAMTATASTKGQRGIIDGLKMKSPSIIVKSPIRENISLDVLER